MAEDGHGCHGEDCAYGSVVASDSVKPLLLTAVLVQGRRTDQSSHHLAVEMLQLWQFGDGHRGHYGANPGHTVQQLDPTTLGWMVAQPVLGSRFEGCSQSQMGPNAGLHGGGCAIRASFLMGAHGGQRGVVVSRAHAGLQVGIRQRPHRRDPDMPARHPAAGRPLNPP